MPAEHSIDESFELPEIDGPAHALDAAGFERAVVPIRVAAVRSDRPHRDGRRIATQRQLAGNQASAP
jgi:hypothetical protein